MSETADALAGRFEAANTAVLTFLEELPEADWLLLIPNEERTVAALAHHVAWGYAVEIEAFHGMAVGGHVDVWARGSLDRINAQHAEEYAECDKEETLDLLRQNASRSDLRLTARL